MVVTTAHNTKKETLDEKLTGASALATALEFDVLQGKTEAIDYYSGKRIDLSEIVSQLRKSDDKYVGRHLPFSEGIIKIGDAKIVLPYFIEVEKRRAPLYAGSAIIIRQGLDPVSGEIKSAVVYIPAQRTVATYWEDKAEKHINEGKTVAVVLPDHETYSKLKNQKTIGVIFTSINDAWIYKSADEQ